MTVRLLVRAVLPTLLASGLLARPPAFAASTCSWDCAQTACTVDCTEADLRDAVWKANLCARSRLYGGRTITFNVDAAGGSCRIAMRQDRVTGRLASCRHDPERYAVCLRGDHLTIDGQNRVTFVYDGPGRCQNCSGSCLLAQPALFTLKGHANTVKNFAMEYFPEGIHIRVGDGHTVSGVTSTFICEDAITVDEWASGGHRIESCTLTGHTAPDPGHTCYALDGTPGLCGIDKAIQVNGGSAVIVGNTIDRIGQPVHVTAGTHTIVGNRTTGAAPFSVTGAHNVCQAYTIAGGRVQLVGNRIAYCKFGIRVLDTAEVEATGNTVTESYVSAFEVKGSGETRLKGAANRMRTSSVSAPGDCQRGTLVVRDNPGARIDFGGGDALGTPVIGTVSSGGNIFCQGAAVDVWNDPDADPSTCALVSGLGASIGARGNCFETLPPRVEDAPPVTVRVDDPTPCAPADCDF